MLELFTDLANLENISFYRYNYEYNDFFYNYTITKDGEKIPMIVGYNIEVSGGNMLRSFQTYGDLDLLFEGLSEEAEKDVKMNADVEIVGDVRNYGNTIVDNNLTTNSLVVNSTSNLKGIINVENTLQTDYYKFDYVNKLVKINGVITLEKDVRMNADVEIVGDLHNYGNTIVDNNLTTNSLVVNSTSDLKGIVNVDNILNIKTNYVFSKWYNPRQVNSVDLPLPSDIEIVPISYGGTGSSNQQEFRDLFYIKLGQNSSVLLCILVS